MTSSVSNSGALPSGNTGNLGLDITKAKQVIEKLTGQTNIMTSDAHSIALDSLSDTQDSSPIKDKLSSIQPTSTAGEMLMGIVRIGCIVAMCCCME